MVPIAILAIWCGESILRERGYQASAWSYWNDHYTNYMGEDLEYAEQFQTYCFRDTTVRVDAA